MIATGARKTGYAPRKLTNDGALVTIFQGFTAKQSTAARILALKMVKYRGKTEVTSVANEIELALMLDPMVATRKANAEKN